MADSPGVTGTQALALVDEVPVWLEINGQQAVTWMCTPEHLEELAAGWLFSEGYIENLEDLKSLKPCASDLGFWAELEPQRVREVDNEERRRVLASGCGSVSVFLADPETITPRPVDDNIPEITEMRKRFKELFARGSRYKETGGIHAAALTDGETLLHHAEDIGRHNAVDKVLGAAVMNRDSISGLGLLVTGRISAELAYKAARAGTSFVATPSVPSTLAAEIARRAGLLLVGRAVSGSPHIHGRPDK